MLLSLFDYRRWRCSFWKLIDSLRLLDKLTIAKRTFIEMFMNCSTMCLITCPMVYTPQPAISGIKSHATTIRDTIRRTYVHCPVPGYASFYKMTVLHRTHSAIECSDDDQGSGHVCLNAPDQGKVFIVICNTNSGWCNVGVFNYFFTVQVNVT